MNQFSALLAAGAAALSPLAAPALAAPTPALQTGQQQVAYIPFDPPLGEPLRYRFETFTDRDGQANTRWSVSSIRFEQAEDGYRMFVTPLSHGTDATDPFSLAIQKHLEEIASRPYAVRLAADGTILAIDDEEAYWTAIFDMLEGAISGFSDEPAFTAAMGEVLKLYRGMSETARLALLTEELVPLVEFAETETVTGERISGTLAGESPLGREINREFHITLDRVNGDVAHLSSWVTVPRAEIEALAARMLTRVVVASPDEEQQLRAGFAALERFTHETRATYQVSMLTGLTLGHRSTEMVEAGAGDGVSRKRTVRTVQALD